MAGRPTIYSPELVAGLLERLCDGESLRSICRDEVMPSKSTVLQWAVDNKEFEKLYRYAREVGTEAHFDEILDIADDGSNDWMEKHNADGDKTGWVENGEAIRRSVLRVDARKWVVARMLPKKYGDRVTNIVEGGDTPLEVIATSAKRRAAALALLMARNDKGGTA